MRRACSLPHYFLLCSTDCGSLEKHTEPFFLSLVVARPTEASKSSAKISLLSISGIYFRTIFSLSISPPRFTCQAKPRQSTIIYIDNRPSVLRYRTGLMPAYGLTAIVFI